VEAGTLHGQAEIGLQVGAVWNRYKVKKRRLCCFRGSVEG
jgi:hypothetical protein